MKRQACLLRDILTGAAGACALSLHLLGERWGLAVAAFLVTVVWIISERRPARIPAQVADLVATACFLAAGALLVWRFAEARLPVTAAGMWCLVAAADVGRMCRLFPVDSSPANQRRLVRRRLRHLGLLAVVSVAVVALGRTLAFELRLPTVMLLAVFVVMVIVRFVRSIANERLAGDDEQVGG